MTKVPPAGTEPESRSVAVGEAAPLIYVLRLQPLRLSAVEVALYSSTYLLFPYPSTYSEMKREAGAALEDSKETVLDAPEDTDATEAAEVIDDDSEYPDEEGFPESSSSEQPAQTKDMTQRLARSRRIMGTSPRVRYSSGNRMVSIEYTMKDAPVTGVLGRNSACCFLYERLAT